MGYLERHSRKTTSDGKQTPDDIEGLVLGRVHSLQRGTYKPRNSSTTALFTGAPSHSPSSSQSRPSLMYGFVLPILSSRKIYSIVARLPSDWRPVVHQQGNRNRLHQAHVGRMCMNCSREYQPVPSPAIRGRTKKTAPARVSRERARKTIAALPIRYGHTGERLQLKQQSAEGAETTRHQ
ncbi:hypothetical protein BC628DRAFT_375142 [Trametes gibbosa]|nr:hypothetical protein BC628DRAFT_375142 [Trametes gibbosa]